MPELTPTDELTGIPLLIVPHEDEVLYLLENPGINAARQAAGEEFADLNHVYHPRTAPELSIGEDLKSPDRDDGLAVRGCRVQMVMRSIHKHYHAAYSGPPIPKTDAERFQAVVLSVGGYVPRQGIELTGTSPKVVDMTDAQIQRLQTSGEVRPLQEKVIRKFLHRYVLNKPETSHIEDATIDEFLSLVPTHEFQVRRRKVLTHRLLAQVIEPVTEPLHEVIKATRQDRLWRHKSKAGPRGVVHDMLIGRGDYERASNVSRIGKLLFDTLAEQQGLVRAA